MDKIDAATPKLIRAYRWAILSRPALAWVGIWSSILFSVLLTRLTGESTWVLFLQGGAFYTIWATGARKNFDGLRSYGQKPWIMLAIASVAIFFAGWTVGYLMVGAHPLFIIDNALAAIMYTTLFAILRIQDHDNGEFIETLRNKLARPQLAWKGVQP